MEITVKNNIDAVIRRLMEYRADVVAEAIPLALNRTAEMVRTAVARHVVSGSGYKHAEALSALSIVRASSGGGKTVKIRAKRKGIPLIRFKAKQTRQGVAVTVGGVTKVIKGAFIATMRSGHVGVFVRAPGAAHKKVMVKGKARWEALPIRELFGPSVGGILAGQAVQSRLQTQVPQVFAARLTHEIARLQKKYGDPGRSSTFAKEFNL